jgi:hypothetical protein
VLPKVTSFTAQGIALWIRVTQVRRHFRQSFLMQVTMNLSLCHQKLRNNLVVSGLFCIFATETIKHLNMSMYEIPYLTACIQAFGRRFSMTRQAAFLYLHEYKGLAFLIEFFDVEHLQSMDETIDDLLIICQKNGGTLA